MTMILPLVSLAIGFLALFAAIWILHKPLDVHKCPSRPVRNVHRALEWILTILGVALLVQIGCLVAAPRRCAAPDPIARNKAAMRRFETCINENDLALGRELISEEAAFATPVSPERKHTDSASSSSTPWSKGTSMRDTFTSALDFRNSARFHAASA